MSVSLEFTGAECQLELMIGVSNYRNTNYYSKSIKHIGVASVHGEVTRQVTSTLIIVLQKYCEISVNENMDEVNKSDDRNKRNRPTVINWTKCMQERKK